MSHEATTDNPYTRGIAEFVSGLRYEAIPPEVLARIKLLMLDALGCAIYGADLEWSRILHSTLAKLDTSNACAVSWSVAIDRSSSASSKATVCRVESQARSACVGARQKWRSRVLVRTAVGAS